MIAVKHGESTEVELIQRQVFAQRTRVGAPAWPGVVDGARCRDSAEVDGTPAVFAAELAHAVVPGRNADSRGGCIGAGFAWLTG